MTGTDWLLALHLLSAVALGAAVTGFWALVLATRPGGSTLPSSAAGRLSAPLTVAVSVGSIGTLVFGVWLAIVVDAYHAWDGWVVAAIVLWAVATGVGQRANAAFGRGTSDGWTQGLRLQAVASAAVVVVLVLMIWKPGA